MIGRQGSLLLVFAFVLLIPPVRAAAGPASFGTSAPPPWVQVAALENAELPSPSGSSMTVLDDHQTRVTDRSVERYVRHVLLVASQKDLENQSQVQIEFEPSYQTLTIHHIRIHRGAAVTNVLHPGEIKVLHREEELEEQIFNGTVQAVAILSDVRVGDMIDYAYTIAGDNPVMAGKFDDVISLEPAAFTRRLRARLLWPQNRKLSIRPHNTGLDPHVTIGDETEYVWERRNASPLEYEDRVPGWYFPGVWVAVSEFGSWGDVVAWGLPLYRTGGALSPELQAQVDAIAKASVSPEARIIAALRFVQDEVRYLGIEMGEYSHQPTTPAKVLARRFGDCKDKALLLTTMLQALGIDAAPALVNTESGPALDSRQPSPYAFDHVIVNVRLKNRTYWLDGTRTFQRGGLTQFYNPAFAKALVLRSGSNALEDIPQTALTNPTVFATERYVVTSLTAPVALTVTTVYTGEGADDMRYDLSRLSVEKLAKRYLNYYADDNPLIEASGPPTIEDDESTNTLTVTERYAIPNFWKDSIHVVGADRIWREIRKPKVSRRAMPLEIPYPLHIRQRIEVEMPEPADGDKESFAFHDSAVTFEHTVERSGKLLVLNYSLRTARDHVEAKDIRRHLATLDSILDNISYEVPMYPSRVTLDARNRLMALLSVVAIGAVGFIGVKVVTQRRNAIRRARFLPRRGEGPSTAIDVPDASAMRRHLEPQSCRCGRRFDLAPQSMREEHLAYDGDRITVLSIQCAACNSASDVYFKVG